MFTDIPREIVIDILSRLAIRSIIACKFVCKSWRNFVDSHEFGKSHLCKAGPHLVLYLGIKRSNPYKMVEFVDEHCSTHHCKIVANLSFPCNGDILGSVNGLLFWCHGLQSSRYINVCNPITREYIELPPPPLKFAPCGFTAGVGVSKMGGQYKIVRILQDYKIKDYSQPAQWECQLHTLGTGSWRSFPVGIQFDFEPTSDSVGAFFNGNLHWLARDSRRISCFDLETELFTSFSSPPGIRDPPTSYKTRDPSRTLSVSVVGDRLCLCDNCDYAAEIWFMNEYGVEKSWTKEFIIRDGHRRLCGLLFPIKMFINGDILIVRKRDSRMLCYSKTTNKFYGTGIHPKQLMISNDLVAANAVIYTPTFLSLRTLLMVTTENIHSFDDV